MSSDTRNKRGVPKGRLKPVSLESNVIQEVQHSTMTKTNIPDRSPDSRNRQSNNKSIDTTGSSNKSLVSNQRTSTSDRLSSLFDGSQENKRPILRVNLIKKSNKQSNILNLGTNRRLQTNRTTDNVPGSNPIENNTNLRTNNELARAKVSGINFGEKRISGKSNPEKVLDQAVHYEDAKKSQKLVLSLIKDISKTVSNESFDEMLKEIYTAIGEIQQQRQSSLKAKNEVEASIKYQANKGTSKKRQLDQMNAGRRNEKEASISSDASNSSEPKEVNRQEEDTSLDNNFILSKHEAKVLSEKLAKKSANQTMNDKESDLMIRNDLHKQFMDLSSDDDTGEDLNREPNSSRLPERCLRITSSHAKYISPHRKRSLEERLSRAQEAREKFLEYRANRFRDILKKVEEVRIWKEEDSMNLKAALQTKLQKAAIKRKEQLDKIIRKAHDEDSKVSEIQFINNLEAQNRRHDMNSRKKEFEARLQELQDERQRRFEEKQAKEAAAEERRKTLEAERKAKLLEIQKRRRIKNQKVEQQQQVKEKKRMEKNRNREQKITAIKEAYHAGVQTLKKRINQKQEQSERRHEVNLRLIRQKAFELSIKRYNSFISESNAAKANLIGSDHSFNRQKDGNSIDTRRLQLKPFNTKKFCNLCKETISTELAFFSHLRSDAHLSSINEHYGDTMLTTNEAVEIHNLRHIVDTDEPTESDKGANSDDQQSSRASSLVNYYHSPHLSQANGGICMSENDRDSLLAIERKCRKLRHKLIAAGKPFNRDWFIGKIRVYLAQLIIQQRVARNQTTNTDTTSLANMIDLSANNAVCQQNKPFYLKMNRIARELVSVTMDQRISGGGLMPAGIIHSVDRLLADLNKQLVSRKVPQLPLRQSELSIDQLSMATKTIESYAIDTLFLYDIVAALVSILRRIVPNVSLTSKLPSTVASHYSTLIDPISLNSYYYHRSPILPARIYIRMIGMLQNLCENYADLCYIIFQSNNMISLSDILSYRLGFIIGNESPASSISGSSSAATLSAHTIDRKQVKAKQQNNGSIPAKLFKSPATKKLQTNAMSDRLEQQNNEKSGSSQVGQSSGHPGGRFTKGDDDSAEDEDEKDDVDEDNDEEDAEEEQQDEEDDENNDKDFWDRAETYKRTEDIVDDMTAGLCKLLATVTETILTKPLVLLGQLDKGAFDQRSHDFISYMVSVGIVDTESVIMSHIHQQQHHHHQMGPASTADLRLGQQDSSGFSAQAITAALLQSGCGSSTSNHADGAFNGNISTLSVSTPQTAMATATATGPTAAAAVSPISANNKIINFTTSCIQFVTSLVKLVAAKLSDHGESDIGAIKQQDDGTQLLATLKMTQLSGVLTLVYDMLVNSFNSLQDYSLQQQQQQNNNNNNNNNNNANTTTATSTCANSQRFNQLNLALHSLRLINYIAYIDIRLLQEALSVDEMLPLQLRHVCSYLISHLVHSANFQLLEPVHVLSADLRFQQKSATSSASTAAAAAVASPAQNLGVYNHHQTEEAIVGSFRENLLKNELINEIILLIGHFAYLNQDNQLMLKSGSRPTIIEQLIGLPFDYFSRSNLQLVLMPTLISCAHMNEQICALVSQELSLTMLTSFIEDQLLAAQMESSNSTQQHNKANACRPLGNLLRADELSNAKSASTGRWRFERRFAKSRWLGAKKYFEAQQAKLRQSA